MLCKSRRGETHYGVAGVAGAGDSLWGSRSSRGNRGSRRSRSIRGSSGSRGSRGSRVVGAGNSLWGSREKVEPLSLPNVSYLSNPTVKLQFTFLRLLNHNHTKCAKRLFREDKLLQFFVVEDHVINAHSCSLPF